MRSGEIRWENPRSQVVLGWSWMVLGEAKPCFGTKHHFPWATELKIGGIFSLFDFLSIEQVRARSHMVKKEVYNEKIQNKYQNLQQQQNWLAREPGGQHQAREPGRSGKNRKINSAGLARPRFWNFPLWSGTETGPRRPSSHPGLACPSGKAFKTRLDLKVLTRAHKTWKGPEVEGRHVN